ncbi:MAG: hypothetical protein WKF77_08445 [Planctomycetaceae bacterium]
MNRKDRHLEDLAAEGRFQLNNRINEELEGMAKLLYDYWFVQFDFPITAAQAAAMRKPRLEGKPFRASGGELIYNKALKREIPMGWEVKEIGEVLAKESQNKKIPASEILKAGRFPVIYSAWPRMMPCRDLGFSGTLRAEFVLQSCMIV